MPKLWTLRPRRLLIGIAVRRIVASVPSTLGHHHASQNCCSGLANSRTVAWQCSEWSMLLNDLGFIQLGPQGRWSGWVTVHSISEQNQSVVRLTWGTMGACNPASPMGQLISETFLYPYALIRNKMEGVLLSRKKGQEPWQTHAHVHN